MHFLDLSPYCYTGPRTGLPGVVNVGWLSASAKFSRQKAGEPLVRRLAELVTHPVHQTRGGHECEFCGKADGSAEIWLVGLDGTVFAAPTLVAHYVEAHDYAPPASFIQAALNGHTISESECEARINAQFRKLATAPTAEDILVPWYETKLYWRAASFPNLDGFRQFIPHYFLGGEGRRRIPHLERLHRTKGFGT